MVSEGLCYGIPNMQMNWGYSVSL